MNISAPFIARPVATSLLAVALFLCGWLGYLRLPVSPLPQVDFPTIQITTRLPGASPDTISKLVTASLERQMGQIPSLTSMSSQSSFGLSQITLQFDLDRDIDAAAQDVQSAVNAASATLPRDLPYPPVYSKVNPADAPVVSLALVSSTLSLRALSDIADTMLSPHLSELTGVGRVSIEGGVKPAIRIQANLARLAGYNLALEDLRQALVAANAAGAKGSLDGARQAYTIDANDQIASAQSYRNIVVAFRNGAPVILKDVADVVEGLENSRVGGWLGEKPAVVIDVRRQPNANIVAVADMIKAELPRLQSSLPNGVELKLVHDRTESIRASISDVEFTLVVATILVVLVVLFFLRTMRATIIAAITLPLSIVATFAFMWLCGFSLDNLSLMALTIGTGFIVDDAIVMIENIVRNIEEGKPPLQAAFDGSKEIGFTVVSLTVSLIAVFIPLLFMTGIVGRMFREFALTLSLAVIVSAVVSLTLTPMLCAYILKREGGAVHAEEKTSSFYETTLRWAVANQSLMLGLTGGAFVLTIALYIFIGKGFLPLQDNGLLNIAMEASADVSFEEMQRLRQKAARIIGDDPDVANVVSVLGVGSANPTLNVGSFSVMLRASDARDAHIQDIADRLQARLSQNVPTRFFIKPMQEIQIAAQTSRSLYQYTLTSANSKELSYWANKLVGRLQGAALFQNVSSETPEGGVQTFIDINRDTAGRLGVTAQAIDDALHSAFGQRQVTTIYEQVNQYRVVLEAAPQFLMDPKALSKLYVVGANGVQTPLSAVTRIRQGSAPLVVAHQDQFPAIVISFDLARGAALGDAVKALQKIQSDIGMPGSILGSFSADAAEFQKSLANEPLLLLAAVVTIYLVLGILYESYAHPFTILTTLPSAGVGALLALMLFGFELDVIGLIGIILLMGIVKKNAIMMIDFALAAERLEGQSPHDAIIRAALLRLRPILMTTLAALLGALPLALSHGVGSELRAPLGVSIIGGLILSQILTLYTTPVIYLAVGRLQKWAMGASLNAANEPAQ